MKIDGMDWLDWLHKTREESEKERRRLGISGVERLRRAEERAAEIEQELAERNATVARDRKAER